jgi:hypothetical protein
MANKSKALRRSFRKLPLFIAALLVFGLGLLPFYSAPKTGATGQILHRALSISSGVPGQVNTSYTFTFRTVTTTSPIAGIKLIACDTAIGSYIGGTCNAPTGLSFSGGAYSAGAQGGFTDATAFSFDNTGANDCLASANVICINRSAGSNDTQTGSDKTISFSGITNPSTANSTFFVGIITYSTNTYTAGSRVDAGTTASAVVQTLTTSAAVAEILNFCVGSTTINDASTTPASDCSTIGGTSVNIGTLDTSTINISPININGGDNKNGVAMLRTNAVNGASVSYDAIQQSGTNHQGTLRISGASCNAGNVSTDSCINAAGGTQATFTAGVEEFGMTIAGTNCGSVSPSSYSCVYGSGTEHLVPSTNYVGSPANAFGTANGFAWVENGTVTQIASSTSVVDDEALILKFAATPAITTPFGSYAAQSDYIAVATY